MGLKLDRLRSIFHSCEQYIEIDLEAIAIDLNTLKCEQGLYYIALN
jgi:hypothetical protein